jgi:membrane-bound ClpP family serine protease
VIILGLILLIIGLIVGSGILWIIGLVLILVGALMWLLGSMDRAFMGRRHWY